MTALPPPIERRLTEVALLPPPADRRRIRVALRLRLSDVAEALGVVPDTVARWERGTASPRGDQRRRYAALLGDLAARETAGDA